MNTTENVIEFEQYISRKQYQTTRKELQDENITENI